MFEILASLLIFSIKIQISRKRYGFGFRVKAKDGQRKTAKGIGFYEAFFEMTLVLVI